MNININGKELDTDLSMVPICSKIRKLAKLDRITLDDTVHRSGLNKHLLAYLAYCGINELDFIKDYLSNLQPYMLERRKDQEPDKSFICVVDNTYRVSVYIKIDSTQYEELIVSFHEDNKRGIAKDNNVFQQLPDYVPIFADCVTSRIDGSNNVTVKVFVQRGVMTLPIDLPAYMYNNIFIIYRKYIETEFIEKCNEYLRNLYTSDLDINFDEISIFSALQQLTFTSYGRDTFSTISLLIDSLQIQNHYVTRRVADFALVTFVKQLKLTKARRDDLIDLLETRYSVSSYKDINLVIQRITDNLNDIVELSLEEEKIWSCIPPTALELYGSTKREQLDNYLKEHDV